MSQMAFLDDKKLIMLLHNIGDIGHISNIGDIGHIAFNIPVSPIDQYTHTQSSIVNRQSKIILTVFGENALAGHWVVEAKNGRFCHSRHIVTFHPVQIAGKAVPINVRDG